MSKPNFVIDTAKGIYELNGKRLDYVTELNIRMKDGRKTVELTYDDADVSVNGVLVMGADETKPTVCDCGFEISPYNFDMLCKCPSCGRNVSVFGGIFHSSDGEKACGKCDKLFNRQCAAHGDALQMEICDQ